MKITTDYYVKPYTRNNSSIIKNNTVDKKVITKQISEYNPIYYKTINFKGDNIAHGFETYFPTDILKMSEQEFNATLLKVIENPTKRNKLAEYVTSLTAKDNQTMNFINMWKRQIPTLISQGLITTMPANTSDFFRRISILGSKNSANSSLQKFLNSDFQTDIIVKDGKSVTAGIIACKLFNLANISPEPSSKVALYLSAILVGAIGYNERGKDVQKIQNQQFLQAIKEMIKIGVLDPYLLLHHVDKSKVNLSEEDQVAYENWKIDRIKDINYQNTGVTVDKHNDFDTSEARNVLIVLIKTLQTLGFDDEKIGAFLQYFAATYDSVGETREAEYLIRMAVKTYDDIGSPKIIDATETLAYLCEKNQKYTEALEELFNVCIYADNDTDPDYSHRLNAQLNMFNINSKLIAKTRKLDYILHEDEKISKSKDRKEAFSKLFTNSSFQLCTSEKTNLQQDELSAILALAQAGKISKNKLKSFLKTLSSYPLESLNYKPSDTRTFASQDQLTLCLGDHYVLENKEELLDDIIIASNKQMAEEAKDIENEILSPDFTASETPYEKASIVVGSNLLNGTLDKCVQQILQKETKDCTTLDYDILKICADRLAMTSKDDYMAYYNGNYRKTPEYLYLLQKRVDIAAEKYGSGSEKFYAAVAEYGEQDLSPQTLIYKIIPILKNAPESIKNKYLPDMYARYGKMKNFEIQTHKNIEFYDKQALEIIIAYAKYLETTKKIDETKLMEFLNFLDDIYTKPPEETCSVGLGYYHETPVFNVPLFDKINSPLTSKKEYDKYDRYTSWDLANMNDLLESLVQKAPGIYRVNERKYLDMKKKHESVWFQKRFNEKMDNQIIAIEKSVDNPKLQ